MTLRMCLPKANIPNPQPPAAAPAPNQPAATVNQSNPFNSATNMNGSNAANRSGVSSLTVPMIARPSLGGVGPVGLGIPAA